MLAAVCHGARDVRIEAVPDAPLASDEVRVAVAYGGICGSDLHYYRHGGVGDFSLREPMVLGHEVSGSVIEVGGAVRTLTPGTKAALNPSRPCRMCAYCRAGRSNLCNNMFFLGSAGRYPHVQGGFTQHLVLREDQVIPVAPDTDLLRLSVAEPLSVGLHAVNRGGALLGKRVIVAGSGPIGLLTARAAALAGASEIVCTDIEDAPLAVATAGMGATRTINVARDPDALGALAEADDYFDVAFEASGSQQALQASLGALRRGGRLVQIGMFPPGMTSLPVNILQSREIELVGAFRAHEEFRLAVALITHGIVDVDPILSGTYPLADATTALERAGDRTRIVKLHLAVAEPQQ